MTSRMISYPLCIHDCDIPVQACAAFVLTNEERAKDLRNPPVYVRGTSAPVGAPKSLVMSLEEFMGCGAMVGRHLWRQAGVGPEDVSIANLYDGFSMLTPMWAEALGFCGEGEGFSWMNETSLPLNTSSGNLGSGRTHGISQMLDSVLQLMGRRRPCASRGRGTRRRYRLPAGLRPGHRVREGPALGQYRGPSAPSARGGKGWESNPPRTPKGARQRV